MVLSLSYLFIHVPFKFYINKVFEDAPRKHKVVLSLLLLTIQSFKTHFSISFYPPTIAFITGKQTLTGLGFLFSLWCLGDEYLSMFFFSKE